MHILQFRIRIVPHFSQDSEGKDFQTPNMWLQLQPFESDSWDDPMDRPG